MLDYCTHYTTLLSNYMIRWPKFPPPPRITPKKTPSEETWAGYNNHYERITMLPFGLERRGKEMGQGHGLATFFRL